MAVISASTADPRVPAGVPLGFYRVEVSKAGENIPAKYNTDTTFGQEVAPDARGSLEAFSLI